jgi:hypothetical protein
MHTTTTTTTTHRTVTAASLFAAAATMQRARQPLSLHATALAARTTLFATAAAASACNPECDTRDAYGVCDAHRRATPANTCLGHRHNRK